jgi:hypothetical protein
MQLTGNKYILITSIAEKAYYQIFKIIRLTCVRFEFQTPEVQSSNYINLSG